jgi:hypothetical protein
MRGNMNVKILSHFSSQPPLPRKPQIQGKYLKDRLTTSRPEQRCFAVPLTNFSDQLFHARCPVSNAVLAGRWLDLHRPDWRYI